MKKVISFLIILLFVASCAPSPEVIQTAISQTQTAMPTETSIPTPIVTPTPQLPSIEEVMNLFLEANLPITDITYYTEENDPNELLGRPNQYIAKVVWIDSRIDGASEPGVDSGGSIEVFTNQEDMEARKVYIDAITTSVSIFAEYSYDNGIFLLRLSHSLTPTEAKGYEDVFMNFR